MVWSIANTFNAIAGAGVLALFVTAGQIEADTPTPGVDPIITAAKSGSPFGNGQDQYMIIDHRSDRTCLLALHRAPGYDVHRLEAGKDCGAVHASLEQARVWHESPQGTVTVADLKGNMLMRLAPGDGPAYEVMAPANLLLSIEAF